MPTTAEIRTAFLEFFARHGHGVLPSASLVPQNDPTLMFTAAGMVPFKNIFTGVEKPPSPPRAATAQKCVRAGGKHNDLDNVGYTARHHTFFEMLGNFSFGDYFKEQAIDHAWELLTKDFALNPDKLCVTVYHDDDAAWNHWKKITGFADHRIIRISSADNFWSAGDTGPCGPCSETFYDHGDHIPGGPPGSPEQDGDRFVEVWNLVFMQYEQIDAATRVPLPKPSIDTGMGLERLVAVMQGVHDNYDIDLFQSLIQTSREISGNRDAAHAVSHRVIADHLRASCFLMADGVMPSNEGRGYVLRRIMRRAMRHAHQLGCREPLMHKLVPALTSAMGDAYPELRRAEASLADTLRQEEERFKQTLERGLKLLDEETAPIPPGGMLPGTAAFKLYDTYGFPLDLTQDILRTRGLSVDVPGFDAAMEGQREMARAAWSGSGETSVGKVWFALKEAIGPTRFLGYEREDAEATVRAIVKNGAAVERADAGDEVFILLDQTPFYGESGGQMGDVGELLAHENASVIAEVKATAKPVEDFHVHHAVLRAPLTVGATILAHINKPARTAIRANHSATHLLHQALRARLGAHVSQKGSLVSPEKLRFDFSHGAALSREEIEDIELAVNRVIWRNTPIETRIMKHADALAAGALGLFGEKYGEEVRVLSIGHEDTGGGYSTELCGGTHAHATGDIGLFKIISEGAVASGIRRIEAVTREDAFSYLTQQEKALRTLADSFKLAPAEVPARVQKLQDDGKKLAKELADAKKQLALGGSGSADAARENIAGIAFAARSFDDLSPKDLRAVAEELLQGAENSVAVAATAFEGKASLVVAVSKALSARISAVTLVQAAVALLGGKGGGGKPELAQGGGPEAGKLAEAVEAIKASIAA